MNRLKNGIISVFSLSLLIAPVSSQNVSAPLVVNIEPLGEPTHERLTVRISARVPRYAGSRETQIKLKLHAEGIVQLAGPAEWIVNEFTFDKGESWTRQIEFRNYGEGSIHAQAETFDTQGNRLWGAADTLFVLNTPEEILTGKSSLFELKRQKLNLEKKRGRLTASQFETEFENLMQSKELDFEREMRRHPFPPKKTKKPSK